MKSFISLGRAEIRPHWVSLRAAGEHRDRLMQWARERWGESRRADGKLHCESGAYWPVGVLVAWNPRDGSDLCFVQLSGQVFDEEGPLAFMLLAELYSMGCHGCTRLDVAVDVKGPGVDLVATVEAACVAGEMAGVHRSNWRAIRNCWKGRMFTGTVEVGDPRGEGRSVRVYDKGFEQKGEPDQWQRFEAVFKKDRACAAFLFLIRAWMRDGVSSSTIGNGETVDFLDKGPNGEAPPFGFIEAARFLVAGHVTFVERSGASRSLRRAKLARWWVEFTAGVIATATSVTKRTYATLERFGVAYCRQWMETLWTMARRTGHSLDEVCENLLRLAGRSFESLRDRETLPVLQYVRSYRNAYS